MTDGRDDRRTPFRAGHPALATLVALALLAGVSGVASLIGSGEGSQAVVTHRHDGGPRAPSVVRPVLALLLRSEHKPAARSPEAFRARVWSPSDGLEPRRGGSLGTGLIATCVVREALLSLPPPNAIV